MMSHAGRSRLVTTPIRVVLRPHTHVSEFNDASESLSHRTVYDRLYCLNEIVKQIERERGVPATGQAVHDISSEMRNEGRSWYSHGNNAKERPPI